jgi:hypothetical protein
MAYYKDYIPTKDTEFDQFFNTLKNNGRRFQNIILGMSFL